MAMKNGFGKCGEKIEYAIKFAITFQMKLRDDLEFSHGVKPYCELGGVVCQKPIRESHIWGVRLAVAAAGGLIAFYQIGYDIAAFGVGRLQTWAGLALNIIYEGTAAVA